jgi:hypothetical protein
MSILAAGTHNTPLKYLAKATDSLKVRVVLGWPTPAKVLPSTVRCLRLAESLFPYLKNSLP